MQFDDRNEEAVQLFHFNGYTVGKDIVKNIKLIIIIAVAVALFAYSYQAYTYTETYTMTTTFTVTTESSADTYSDMTSAANTASSFQTLLNSSVIQQAVANAAGMSGIPGTVDTSVLENTNLMTLTVTESSPQMSYVVMKAILDNYSAVSDKILGNVVLHILDQSDIPGEPDTPFAPQKLMVEAFAAALVLMLVLVALVSMFKDTIRTESDIERKLDTKRLGTLYHEKKYKSFRSRKKGKKTGILITNPTVSFRYSEALRRVTSRVKSKMEHRGAKVILVTSVLENEGKSTVAVNLALELAEESSKVLLLDGDFRKPALYKLCEVDPKDITDFGEVLNGNTTPKNLIFQKEQSNLKLLLNTVSYPNSTELLSQGLLEKILREMRGELDYIIIDCSPMALVADAEEMLNMIDAAVLVVRQHFANVRDINDAIDIINFRGEKLLGCVFNDVGGERMGISHGMQEYGGYGSYKSYGYGHYAHTREEE